MTIDLSLAALPVSVARAARNRRRRPATRDPDALAAAGDARPRRILARRDRRRAGREHAAARSTPSRQQKGAIQTPSTEPLARATRSPQRMRQVRSTAIPDDMLEQSEAAGARLSRPSTRRWPNASTRHRQLLQRLNPGATIRTQARAIQVPNVEPIVLPSTRRRRHRRCEPAAGRNQRAVGTSAGTPPRPPDPRTSSSR